MLCEFSRFLYNNIILCISVDFQRFPGTSQNSTDFHRISSCTMAFVFLDFTWMSIVDIQDFSFVVDPLLMDMCKDLHY